MQISKHSTNQFPHLRPSKRSKSIWMGRSSSYFQQANTFDRCDDLTGKGIFTFFNSLKNHEHLKKVDLKVLAWESLIKKTLLKKLSRTDKYDPNILASVGKGLKRLHHLQDLSMAFYKYWPNSQFIFHYPLLAFMICKIYGFPWCSMD